MNNPDFKPFPTDDTFAADLLVARVKLKAQTAGVELSDLWIRRILWSLDYEGDTRAFHRAVRRQRYRRLRAILSAPFQTLFAQPSIAFRRRVAARRGA